MISKCFFINCKYLLPAPLLPNVYIFLVSSGYFPSNWKINFVKPFNTGKELT